MSLTIQLLSEAELKVSLDAIEDFYAGAVTRRQLRTPDDFTLSALEYAPRRYERTLVIIPGRAECEHKYAELLYSLRELPVRVLVIFVRGQGASTPTIPGSRKCHISDFNLYRKDAEFMVRALEAEDFSLLGFSMGGLISTDFYVNSGIKPRRLALIAPYLWPAYNLPAPVLQAFVSFMGSLPGLKLLYTPHGSEYRRIAFEDNIHSHSRLRYELYHDYYAAHPQEAQSGPSYGFVLQSLKKQRELAAKRFDFTIPVFCAAAGNDQVVSTPHCAAFMQRHARDSLPPQYLRVSGAYHDILNEKDEFRNPVLTRALTFLLA